MLVVTESFGQFFIIKFLKRATVSSWTLMQASTIWIAIPYQYYSYKHDIV